MSCNYVHNELSLLKIIKCYETTLENQLNKIYKYLNGNCSKKYWAVSWSHTYATF